MRSLKEALLNRSKNIDVAGMAIDAAKAYINANYNIEGKLTFEIVNGICTANCDGAVVIKNKKIVKLTDGFVWGQIKKDFYCSYCNGLTSLKGAPDKVGGYFYCSYCDNNGFRKMNIINYEVKSKFINAYIDSKKSIELIEQYWKHTSF